MKSSIKRRVRENSADCLEQRDQDRRHNFSRVYSRHSFCFQSKVNKIPVEFKVQGKKVSYVMFPQPCIRDSAAGLLQSSRVYECETYQTRIAHNQVKLCGRERRGGEALLLHACLLACMGAAD